jgi:hypothetical protein
VRAWALHALACDHCKEGDCRLDEDETVPVALRMLKEDRSRKVRTMAAHAGLPVISDGARAKPAPLTTAPQAVP